MRESGETKDEKRRTGSRGARADFAAQLPRRVSELRHGVALWEAEPAAARLRDDLRRRLHALGSAAKVLRFANLAECIGEAESVLERMGPGHELGRRDLNELREAIEAMPAFAESDEGPSSQAAESKVATSFPMTVLVVGAAGVADALIVGSYGAIDHERTEDTESALHVARALAPDVVILETSLSGAEALLEKLVADPLTEPVPVLALGSFPTKDDAASWLARGATRVLSQPISAEALREACLSLARGEQLHARPLTLGEVTVEELAVRLGEEIKRGLVDAANVGGRHVTVDLGEGHEELAVLWGAVARVQEIVAGKAKGAIRFSGLGPEGGLPLGAWTSRGSSPARGLETTRLEGRTVIVVDDDVAVVRLIAGVLRAAGASVQPAHDGEMALSLACRAMPDLIVSDLLMPKMDGFALCRAIKRDVALRDVPVILLSWKDDLLQRSREMGADADGYLRKEASAAVILERATEALRVRARVEQRLAGDGEVRGRLDGLTVPTLLALVRKLRPNARVTVRDACFLYDLEIRDGDPRGVARTTPDGAIARGPAVLGSLIGVSAGRFTISPPGGGPGVDLLGTLDQQLRPLIAQARGAQSVLTGAALLDADTVGLDRVFLRPYWSTLPEPLKSIAQDVAAGVSPRKLVLEKKVAPRLLEDVLVDAAHRGAVHAVSDSLGVDLLTPAVAREATLLDEVSSATVTPLRPLPIDPNPTIPPPPPERTGPTRSFARGGKPRDPSPIPPPPRMPTPIPPPTKAPPPSSPRPPPKAEPEPEPKHQPAAKVEAPIEAPRIEPLTPVRMLVTDNFSDDEAKTAKKVAPAPKLSAPRPRKTPMEEALAAKEEITPAPKAETQPIPAAKPTTEAAAEDAPPDDSPEVFVRMGNGPDVPVSAIDVPEEPTPPPPTTTPAPSAPVAPAAPIVTAGPEISIREALPSDPPEISIGAGHLDSDPPPPRASDPPDDGPTLIEPSSKRRAVKAEPEPKPARKPAAPRSNAVGYFVVSLFVAAITAVWMFRDQGPPEPTDAPKTPPKTSAPATPSTPAAPTKTPAATASLEPAPPPLPEDLALPAGATVPDGYGLLEITGQRRDVLLVDHMDMGRGPTLTVPLPPGIHDVRARRLGEEQPVVVTIRVGRRTRVDLRAPFHR